MTQNRNVVKKTETALTLTGPGGKLPPQAIELEEAVLGALMIDKDAIHKVIDFLKPETFYKPAHQAIYEAIFKLFARTDAIDMLTVTQELRRMGKVDFVGGAVYVMRLTNRVSSAANIETHARQINELAIKRELAVLNARLLEEAFEDESDAFALLAEMSDLTAKISGGIVGKRRKSALSFTKDMIATYKKTVAGGLQVIETGLRALDVAMAGMLGSDIVVLAGRPGMGKTALALHIIRHIAKMQGLPVGVVSLEMTGEQLVRRLVLSDFYCNGLAGEYGYPTVGKIRLGQLSDRELEGLELVAAQSPYLDNVEIDDTAGMNFLQVATTIREMVRERSVKTVVIDYLQLISLPNSKNNTTARELADVCVGLKNLAKELDIVIIELSQLGKHVDNRPDKRPNLGDLKESGGIEECAECAFLIYRPEYYGIMDVGGLPTAGLVELIGAKVRNAAKSSVFVEADLRANLFKDTDNGGFEWSSLPARATNQGVQDDLPPDKAPF